MSAGSFSWRGQCCGEAFTGLPMDIAFDEPVDWDALGAETVAASFVNDDFCEVRYADGEINRFIRCLLPLPVPELDQHFRFLVWISVSENSWDVYEAGFNNGQYGLEGCFGSLMHDISDYQGSHLMPVDVWFGPSGLRPTVQLHDVDHSLVLAQRDGVDVAQIARWAALSHTG